MKDQDLLHSTPSSLYPRDSEHRLYLLYMLLLAHYLGETSFHRWRIGFVFVNSYG